MAVPARRSSRRRGDRSEYGAHEGGHIEQLAPGCHSRAVGRLRLDNLSARLGILERTSGASLRGQVAELRELAERMERRRNRPRLQVDALFWRLLSLEQDSPSEVAVEPTRSEQLDLI